MYKLRIFFLLFLGLQPVLQAQEKASPVKIIFDTDMGPDYDDVGALAILHAFADSGHAEILGTIASTKYDNVAAVLDVLNTYFKRPGIPIGVTANGLTLRDWQHWSDTLVANYPHTVKSNKDVPDATTLYRKLLAAQPDKSVTIVTVGFLTNMAALLKSPPDNYSALDGRELVRQKVKELVSMAGKFPAGTEFNIDEDAAAAKYAYEQWPGIIIFSGFEIGAKINVGISLIKNDLIRHSPVKDVFRICIPMAKEDSAGRMSWDETAVLAGVKGISPFFTLRHGRIIIKDDGANEWSNEGRQHAYLVQQSDPLTVQEYIEKLIAHQPE